MTEEQHHCKYESTIAVMQSDIATIKEHSEKTVKILTGNGEEGLITQLAINKSDTRRLWKWFAVFAIATANAIGGIIYYILACSPKLGV